jgi:hypothetical protein
MYVNISVVMDKLKCFKCSFYVFFIAVCIGMCCVRYFQVLWWYLTHTCKQNMQWLSFCIRTSVVDVYQALSFFMKFDT